MRLVIENFLRKLFKKIYLIKVKKGMNLYNFFNENNIYKLKFFINFEVSKFIFLLTLFFIFKNRNIIIFILNNIYK